MKSFEDTDVLCVAVFALSLFLILNLPATWTALQWLYDGGLHVVHEGVAYVRALGFGGV